MFYILDGREHFYQWDIDRKLVVEDKTINKVYFCNRTKNCSISKYVYDVNGTRLVDVPNTILQDSFRMYVYAYDSNYTKYDASFDIKARSKPEDYIYTEEELNVWDDLEQRITVIEENGVSEETVAAAVDNYLAANPIEAGMFVVRFTETGYNTYSADKNIKEILDAAANGETVVGIEESEIYGALHYNLAKINNETAYFTYQLADSYRIIEYDESGLTYDGGYMLLPDDVEETMIVFYVDVDANNNTTYSKSYVNLLSDYDTYGKAIFCVYKNVNTNQNIMLNLSEHSSNSFVFTSFSGSKYYKLTFNKSHEIVFVEEAFSNGSGTTVDMSEYYTKTETDGRIAAAQPDLSSYALKTEIPDVSNYQTAAQVQTAIENYVGVIENGSY